MVFLNFVSMIAEKPTLDVFARLIAEIGMKYRNVVLLDAEGGLTYRSRFFSTQFPQRSYFFGNCYSTMVGVAAGMAVMGKIPFVVGRADILLTRAYEEIEKLVCRPGLNVKFVAVKSRENDFDDISLAKTFSGMDLIVSESCEDFIARFNSLVLDFGPCYVGVSI